MTQKSPKKEAIAIIGIGCRFPGGANSPNAFWKLLRDGVDAITEVPEDRWNMHNFYHPDRDKPGKINTRYGGFIEQIDQFDAQFFGISPREALRMDPQQRILLEVAWEALEDAGQVLAKLAGTRTSVFIGSGSRDYGEIQQLVSERNFIDPYTLVGSVLNSMTANRISHAFDFRGPSLAVDTACSSSLVAVDIACRSIWDEGCPLALAGGVNAILKPEMSIGLTKGSFLSPDGRCKSFDARANGYVRAEGAGVVVLKPLSSALSDGDPIYAVIRGSAVNHDGHTNGIALPNGAAQEALLREAYRQAGVLPAQVQYIEAHGTGTFVGDPIEANAIGKVLCSNRPTENYCWLDSVKSNIGHLETAAGIAGLIKVALALKHRQIPPNLHFQTPNPEIPFEELRLRVPQTLEPWFQNGKEPRLAGVNSFGAGGTNAHVILEGFETEEGTERSPVANPNQQDEAVAEERALPLPLSARSPEALKASARAYLDFLTAEKPGQEVQFSDLCSNASLRRDHHDHRLAVVASSKEDLAQRLEAFLLGETRRGMSSGRVVSGRSHKLTFVFSGMGQQWWAMGRQLLAQEPVFRQVIEQCDALFRNYVSWSLLAELTAEKKRSRIQQSQIGQPALFSVQVALAALWRSWGVYPDAIVGHSLGEVAAAHVAGGLSLEDAVQVTYHRSRLFSQLAGQGKMLAVALSPEEAKSLLMGYEQQVGLAALNSPKAVTLSGSEAALEEIASFLRQKQIACEFLRVDIPYHSHLMESIKTELAASLQAIRPQPTTVSLFSTVTAQVIEGTELDGAYWAQNMRQPVLFTTTIDRLIQAGHNLFLEVSARPVLGHFISESLSQAGKEGTVLASLRLQEPERFALLGTFGKLYTLGYPVDWKRLYPHSSRFVRLPSYPWQRERYWQESEESQQARLGQPGHYQRVLSGQQVHPLLGCRLQSAQPVWDVEVDRERLPYLYDHYIQGAIVYSGAAFMVMALAAAQETYKDEPYVVEEIEFQRALLLPDGEPQRLQLLFHPQQACFEIYSLGAGSGWVRHVTGKLHRLQGSRTSQPVVIKDIRRRCQTEISKSDFYRQSYAGYEPGSYFRRIERLWKGTKEALGQILFPETQQAELKGYQLHPVFLDAGIQVLLSTIAQEGNFVATGIDRVRFYGSPGLQVWSYARLVEQSATMVKGDIQLCDDSGNVLVEIQGVQLLSLEVAQPVASKKTGDYLYEYRWRLKARPGQALIRSAADAVASPQQIAARVQPVVEQLREQLGRKHYYDVVEPQIDTLCVEYILKAFQELGHEWVLHQRLSATALAQQLGVAPQHWRLFGRIFEVLQSEGILNQVGEQWEVCQRPAVKEPQKTWKTLISQFPAYYAELMLLGSCGQQLAGILRGEVDPLQLIFPQESSATSEHFYYDSLTFRIYNLLVQKVIATALEHLPAEREIRILEIGAGTGGITSYVLPILPAQQTDYVFTDVSQIFTAQAAQKFRDYPFVQYQCLDIEKDPLAQGFEAHSFDLILASNVLHATRDLRQTLENTKQLLSSEGLLLLLEVTNFPLWADLVFGLLKGWWLFSDFDLRPSHPLLSLQKWRNLLKGVGFTEVADLGDPEGTGQSLQSIIVAQGSCIQQQDAETLGETSVLGSTLPPQPEPGSWLIFADRTGVGRQLAELLKERQQTPILITPGEVEQRLDANHFQIRPEHPEDLQHLLAATLAEQPPCRGVVHLWSLDAPPPEETTLSSLQSAQGWGCGSVLHLVQALAKVNWSNASRLWLATRDVQAVGDASNPISIAQAPLWGLGRVIINEHPQLHCTLVDLSSANAPEEIQSLFAELWLNDTEDEIALRGGARYVHRLMRLPAAEVQGTANFIPNAKFQNQNGDQPFRLEISPSVALENLKLRSSPRQQPTAKAVEIQVCAAGLNDQDVAKAMNRFAEDHWEETFSGRSLGIECAGRIAALGEGSEGFEIGDEVIAFAPHSLSTYTTTDARFVVHKPVHLSFEEAASIPLAFLTAGYALHDLGRIREGDRVLVHGATGGVGLAAIQIVQQVGAEILVTADNPQQQDFLRAIGIKHVLDSGSEKFVDAVKKCTAGEGVDIVLNLLGGEVIPQSLSILRACGRFLQIGSPDLNHNHQSGRQLFGIKNLSFFTVDLDRLLRERPDFASSRWREVMRSLTEGTLFPLPHRVFSIAKVVNAFRHQAQAQHIGKIVVSLQDEAVSVASPSAQSTAFCSEGTYLITGGLSELGLTLAQEMVKHGVQHLVLVEQRNPSSPRVKSALEAMREAGAEVVVAQADITQSQQVKRVLADIRQPLPPLRGIIHAASVLDDAVLLETNQQRLEKVIAPILIGAWNLHTQTANIPLDFFILLASATSLLGMPAQGSDSAADAFLEALAHHRHAQGLPALTINWELPCNVGALVQNPNQEQARAEGGIKPLSAQKLLKILGELLPRGAVQMGVVHWDWQQLAKIPTLSASPRFSHLVRATLSDQGQVDAEEREENLLNNTLLAAEPAARQQLLASCLCEQVAKVLGTSPSKLDSERPLTTLGLDSLMAVELSNRLKNEFGVDIPTMKLMDDASIARIAELSLEQLALASIISSEVPSPEFGKDMEEIAL